MSFSAFPDWVIKYCQDRVFLSKHFTYETAKFLVFNYSYSVTPALWLNYKCYIVELHHSPKLCREKTFEICKQTETLPCRGRKLHHLNKIVLPAQRRKHQIHKIRCCYKPNIHRKNTTCSLSKVKVKYIQSTTKYFRPPLKKLQATSKQFITQAQIDVCVCVWVCAGVIEKSSIPVYFVQ